MDNKDVIAIVATKRTPIGPFLGELSPLSAPHLAAQAIEGMLSRPCRSIKLRLMALF